MNALEMNTEGSTDLLESEDFRNSSQSPKTRHRILEFETEDHSENIYKGCCNYSTDKRLLILGTQIGLSAAMLCFSAAMLAIKETGETGIYMSMISSILSFWMGRQSELEKK